ncbi:MAG: tRNA pseudouridine(13) synthase TruD [Proteobacteria bacterium]|nr:tRNA pseudouridine(13) synthase TruD [Pseudomonadota bacterium]
MTASKSYGPLSQQAESLLAAKIKTQPEDWQVTEQLATDFTEAGEHAYLYIQKRCMSTAPVAAWLAKRFNVQTMDVSYAGMKDKHALTRQWFSVRLPGPSNAIGTASLRHAEGDEQIKVLAGHRHQRKLRRGEHQANRFRIVLRDLPRAVDTELLAAQFARGFPNYFGPQRFGRHNFCDALNWLRQRRRRRVSRQQKGWHLSVLRSWVFNELLARRVADGSFDKALDGDLLTTAADGSDAIPLGVLWGRGREQLRGEALHRQQQSLRAIETPDGQQTMAEVCEELEFAGVDRGQRAMLVRPWGIACEQDQGAATLTLSFYLPVGAYATVLLGQWFELQDMSLDQAA